MSKSHSFFTTFFYNSAMRPDHLIIRLADLCKADYLCYDYARCQIKLCSSRETLTVQAASLDEFFDAAALLLGCSITGRKKAYGTMMHQKKQLPIILSRSLPLCFLPTASHLDPDLYYVNYERIASILPLKIHSVQNEGALDDGLSLPERPAQEPVGPVSCPGSKSSPLSAFVFDKENRPQASGDAKAQKNRAMIVFKDRLALKAGSLNGMARNYHRLNWYLKRLYSSQSSQ